MLLSHLTFSTGLDFDTYGRDVELTGISCDSRRVIKGGLFIAIEGFKVDGHGFIPDVIERGAVAVAVSRRALREDRVRISPEITVVAFDDTRYAMAHLFSAWYFHPHRALRMVGVTGTNGKTSTARLLYEVLCRSCVPCGLIGTTSVISPKGEIRLSGNDPLANMTTPDPEQLYAILHRMREDGADTVVMEVTSHALALGKVAPIEFEIGIFTNLTEDHLDLHGDMESYFKAKCGLFERCLKAIINIDDKYGRRLHESISSRITSVTCSGEGRSAILSATDVTLTACGIEYKLCSPSIRARIRSRLWGDFNVMNTLEAIGGAYLLGVPARDIKQAIADVPVIKGRLEKVRLDGRAGFSVYVDYAHTPDALENVLRSVRASSTRCERIVLLFGCGGDRERQKRSLMGRIAVSMADHVIITSDNCRSEAPNEIIEDILSGIDGESSYTVIEDRKEAIEYAVRSARDGDVIILAGKGHEEYEIVGDERRPFNEKELVCRAYEKYRADR